MSAPIKTPAWKVLGKASIWCLAALVGSFLVGFLFGVGVVLMRLEHAVAYSAAKPMTANQTFLALAFSVLGAAVILFYGAYRNGDARNVGIKRIIADASLRRPAVLIFISLAIMTYAVVGTIVIFRTVPALWEDTLLTSFMVDRWVVWVTFIVTIGCAPLAEELFFRGWLWTAFRPPMNLAATALLTSGLWLVVHLPDGLGHVLLLIPVAVALPLARHFGNSVRGAIVVHVANNLAAAVTPWALIALHWKPPG